MMTERDPISIPHHHDHGHDDAANTIMLVFQRYVCTCIHSKTKHKMTQYPRMDPWRLRAPILNNQQFNLSNLHWGCVKGIYDHNTHVADCILAYNCLLELDEPRRLSCNPNSPTLHPLTSSPSDGHLFLNSGPRRTLKWRANLKAEAWLHTTCTKLTVFNVNFGSNKERRALRWRT